MAARLPSSRVLFVLVAVMLAGTATAEVPDFAYTGLAGEPLQRLEIDNGGPFALAADGFHRYVYQDGTWASSTEPGVPGRAVTAITNHSWLDVPAVAGRLGIDGHGYLTIEPLDGTTGPTTHVSTGGEVATFAIDVHWFPYTADLWALTRAGSGPGELLVSTDSGASWTAVTGHGMTDPTGIVVEMRYQQRGVVHLAGEGGLLRSEDSGATWAPDDAGLPAGPVTALQSFGPSVATLPKSEGPEADWMLAATPTGLYHRSWDTTGWELVLAEDCARVETSVLGVGPVVVVVLTADGRLLGAWNPPLSGAWTWEDWSGAFAGMTIVDVAAEFDIFVATAASGAYRVPLGSDVPPAVAGLTLRAVPTPFNPATEVRFTAPRAGHAVLAAYDVAGRRVATLLDGPTEVGPRVVRWRPEGLPSGVYLLRLEVAGQVATRRVVLAK